MTEPTTTAPQTSTSAQDTETGQPASNLPAGHDRSTALAPRRPVPLARRRAAGRPVGAVQRVTALVAMLVLAAGFMVTGASPASAHARCDGQTHTHYYWTGNTATWYHTRYVTQVNRWAPDVTWAYARSSDGQTHANRCFW